MENKPKIKGLLERKLEDPHYRKRFEEEYDAFQLEVQILNAMEKKDWSYSDLAKAIGTNKSNISRDLKGGGLVTATFSRIRRMAEALEMKLIAVLIPREQVPLILPRIEDLIRLSHMAEPNNITMSEPQTWAAEPMGLTLESNPSEATQNWIPRTKSMSAIPLGA